MRGLETRMSVKMLCTLQVTVQTLTVLVAVTVYSRRDTTALHRDSNGSKRNLWGLQGETLGREKDQKKGVWGEISPLRDWAAKEDSSQMWGSLRKPRAWGQQVPLQRHQILGGCQSPRGRAAAHWNWEDQTSTPSSGQTQTWPNCPGLTFTMASNVEFWRYFQMNSLGHRATTEQAH